MCKIHTHIYIIFPEDWGMQLYNKLQIHSPIFPSSGNILKKSCIKALKNILATNIVRNNWKHDMEKNFSVVIPVVVIYDRQKEQREWEKKIELENERPQKHIFMWHLNV